MAHAENLTERALYVANRSQQLLEDLIPGSDMPIDYLSVFSKDAGDYERLRRGAQELGEMVFRKNGEIYLLHDEDQDLPSRVVRVREPGANPRLEGCVDFVVTDYGIVRAALMSRPDPFELPKEGYDIIGVSPPGYDVSAYFPSQRLTETLMGLES